ncbi:MAG: transposase [Candidatus Nomurabacteria bacterium]|nr:transposase [Candidatus Nomurabacteria bacterium]USN88181.1 MAG: transposase [Candidatus Nomurabacteria bacterium]
MSTRTIGFVENEFYHVYNRGVDKRTIFLDSQDYNRFTELMFLSNSALHISVRDIRERFASVYEFDRKNKLVSIGAYCLMPNHFHILITPMVDGGVTAFMKKLATGYSMYFNKKNNRSGSLFQGTFKAEHTDTDEYLKYLYAYIHLNPVKLIDSTWKEEGIKDAQKSYDFCASFQYSSLQDYLGSTRPEKMILNPDSFPEYFETKDNIKEELFEWLNYKDNLFAF